MIKKDFDTVRAIFANEKCHECPFENICNTLHSDHGEVISICTCLDNFDEDRITPDIVINDNDLGL